MAVDPGRIYRELLLSKSDIPADLQKRIFTWGKAQKDYDLLATLQRYEALVDEIDEMLATITNHQVQAAHVSRPGRDMAVLSTRAKKDRRVAVHATLASMPGLDDDAYAIMARTDSRTVAFPLIANRAAPASARAKAMRTVATGISTANRMDASRYAGLLAEFPDMAGEAIAAVRENLVSTQTGSADELEHRSSNAGIILGIYLSRPRASIDDLDQSAVDDLADILAHQLSAAYNSWNPEHGGYDRWRKTSMISIHQEMVQTATASAKLSAEKRKMLIGVLSKHIEKAGKDNSIKKSFDRALELLTETPEAAATMSPVRLYNETDPAKLLDAAKTFDKSAPAVAAIATAIASNPAATAEIVNIVMERCSYQVGIDKVLANHAGNLDVIAVVFGHNPYAVSDTYLEMLQDPRAAIALLCATNPGFMAPRLISSRFMTREIVGILPVSFLETLVSSESISASTKSMVMDHLVERLGTDTASWELFEEFSPAAPGSIDQLIDQIQNIIRLQSRNNAQD